MDQLPEFWRTEVFHPLFVHFPIALVVLALVFKFFGLFSKTTFPDKSGSILLYLGVIAAWVAVYTGTLADGVVARKICDPTVLKNHESTAFALAWVLSGTAFLDLILLTPIKYRLVLKTVVLVALLTANIFIIYVGHTGATLVYQQGAGVYKPGPGCPEF